MFSDPLDYDVFLSLRFSFLILQIVMCFNGWYFLFFCRGFKLVGPMVIMIYRWNRWWWSWMQSWYTGEPAITSPQLLYFIFNPECWLKILCALASSTSSSSWVLVRCLLSPKDFLRLKVYYCPGLLHHLHESHSEFGLCYQLNINVKRLCLKA